MFEVFVKIIFLSFKLDILLVKVCLVRLFKINVLFVEIFV